MSVFWLQAICTLGKVQEFHAHHQLDLSGTMHSDISLPGRTQKPTVFLEFWQFIGHLYLAQSYHSQSTTQLNGTSWYHITLTSEGFFFEHHRQLRSEEPLWRYYSKACIFTNMTEVSIPNTAFRSMWIEVGAVRVEFEFIDIMEIEAK